VRFLPDRRDAAADGEAGHLLRSTADIVNDLTEAGGDYDNAALKRRGEMMRPILKAAIGKAIKYGVKIVAGSDTSCGPNSVARISRDRQLVAAGMTPLGRCRPRPSSTRKCCG
jgi:imidazolonepropionase-like amidohydrolase